MYLWLEVISNVLTCIELALAYCQSKNMLRELVCDLEASCVTWMIRLGEQVNALTHGSGTCAGAPSNIGLESPFFNEKHGCELHPSYMMPKVMIFIT